LLWSLCYDNVRGSGRKRSSCTAIRCRVRCRIRRLRARRSPTIRSWFSPAQEPHHSVLRLHLASTCAGPTTGQQVDVAFSGCLSGQDDSIGLGSRCWCPTAEPCAASTAGLGRLVSARKPSVVPRCSAGAEQRNARRCVRLNWAAGFNETISSRVRRGTSRSRVTLISNSIELRSMDSIASHCFTEPRGTRRGLAGHGPLTAGYRIKSARVGALADHILRYATTIIRPRLITPVIVTSRPVRACAAATRIARLVRPHSPRHRQQASPDFGC